MSRLPDGLGYSKLAPQKLKTLQQIRIDFCKILCPPCCIFTWHIFLLLWKRGYAQTCVQVSSLEHILPAFEKCAESSTKCSQSAVQDSSLLHFATYLCPQQQCTINWWTRLGIFIHSASQSIRTRKSHSWHPGNFVLRSFPICWNSAVLVPAAWETWRRPLL